MRNNSLILLIFAACVISASAAKPVHGLRKPLDIPVVLAGNFGELRPNHFHSGVDFKTQGRTGLPVHAAADGYVSRVLVSPWGFGRAVYISHPEAGLLTVYGHLEAFSPEIDRIVRAKQYQDETFSIDLSFPPGEIPVKKGDIIARSGNAGSSFGPHLHFDVRDLKSGDALDPLEYYMDDVKDTTPPEARHLALYAVPGKGAVSGTSLLTPDKFASGFTAWGEVYPAINAFDRMDGTHNIYGVRSLVLTVDGKEVYRRTIDRFSFDNTRAVNTLAHYPAVVSSGRWMMHTIVPPTHPLGKMIQAENGGIVNIDREKDYRFVFILTDIFGNTRKVPFTVRGRKTGVGDEKREGYRFFHNGSHRYNVGGVSVTVPEGTLYDDIDFVISRDKSSRFLSDIVSVGSEGIPLASAIDITIPLKKDVNVKEPDKLILARLNSRGNPIAIESRYSPELNAMTASTNRFGRFAVCRDTVPPVIAPAGTPLQWKKNGTVRIKITDNLAGVDKYRGEIDGKFVLFELDGKTATASFRLDPQIISRNRKHTLLFTAADACGNKSSRQFSFQW